MTPGERAFRDIADGGRAVTAERWRTAVLWQLDEIRRALAPQAPAVDPAPTPEPEPAEATSPKRTTRRRSRKAG